MQSAILEVYYFVSDSKFVTVTSPANLDAVERLAPDALRQLLDINTTHIDLEVQGGAATQERGKNGSEVAEHPAVHIVVCRARIGLQDVRIIPAGDRMSEVARQWPLIRLEESTTSKISHRLPF